eukprot:TRINITY_DN269_c3_g1_i1.p1 TRINITY_DN269_c3_g1~~TRINITY_DN269_c3_g1_i1.p1  ORF type:complete len:250 (-),score=54.95 TRINITY_DN269_c3_g1_i1:201-950(-)
MRSVVVRRMSSSVTDNLRGVLSQIQSAYENATHDKRAKDFPTLVAVSKTKSKDDIIEAYNAGQRIFGENYVQELHEKSLDPELRSACPELSWHFIGAIQSKQVSKLLKVPGLELVHTVGSRKIAERLQRCLEGQKPRVLDVLVQVNVSREEAKSGVAPGEETLKLASFIHRDCEALRFRGLMAIGAPGEGSKDFAVLRGLRNDTASSLRLPNDELRLSMGMSADLEEAVSAGSTDLRIGRQIFGERNYK